MKPHLKYSVRGFALSLGACAVIIAAEVADAPAPALRPIVDVEEDVYTYVPADNGAGPLWCGGSTCIVRLGDAVFASGIETLKDWPPLNNCRWTFHTRGADGWRLVRADPQDRTREPSPLAAFPEGRIFLSANPTLRTNREPGGGPARPVILEFSAKQPDSAPRQLSPIWNGNPRFTEHSYRSFAADGAKGEMVLFQNIDYTHAEWSFLDRDGNWSAQGKLRWPWGAEYDKPQPIRICYPTVALRDRGAHFCGVSDIVEPYESWRAFKKELTGRDWDYDFRRLFYTWTPDIRSGKFKPWIEIASRDKTAGWISPCDLWAAQDGAVHVLWTERALDERLRQKFFPDAVQSHALNYALLRDGEVLLRRTLVEAREGFSREVPSAARFQVTLENRLVVFYYVHGTDSSGQPISENRVLEIRQNGEVGESVRVPLRRPFSSTFTATVRAGSPPSSTLDLLGHQSGKGSTISYARVRLW